MDTTNIKSIEKISKSLGGYIKTEINDFSYKLCVNIACLYETDGEQIRNLYGYGFTYADACKDYLDKLKGARRLIYNDRIVIVAP